ncbi:MAG: hypothetical protein A2139_07045 [Desulfobacca sp. RBG_16_60_12]|nr:MAG: hypothetical protein A2139_07045 [Desulfobacca sp. RBG_16_60_12]
MSGREYSSGLADCARIVGLPPQLEHILRGSVTRAKLQGGAVDDVRRSRRVRAIVIALIAPPPIFTRRMDMLMTGEVGVAAVAQNFLQGNYSLEVAAIAGASD